MRENNFNGRLLNITAQTARMAGPNRIASWGDQEYMANYVRFYPESLRVQPCGCNYQWTAARRTIKCPNAPVYMGHGWHAGTTQVTRDPYNKLYHYFKDCEGGSCSAPPFANQTQLSHKDKTSPKNPIELVHNFDCPQQNMVRVPPGLIASLYHPFLLAPSLPPYLVLSPVSLLFHVGAPRAPQHTHTHTCIHAPHAPHPKPHPTTPSSQSPLTALFHVAYRGCACCGPFAGCSEARFRPDPHTSARVPTSSQVCNEDLKDPLFIYDAVHVLTRTSNRPNFFAETC